MTNNSTTAWSRTGESTDRPKRESMSIEEATISNVWEIAAIVEVLERNGLCTKQDLFDIVAELYGDTEK